MAAHSGAHACVTRDEHEPGLKDASETGVEVSFGGRYGGIIEEATNLA